MTKLIGQAAAIAAVLMGFCGLFHLAKHAARDPEPEVSETIAVEMRTVWATQKLIDFCKAHDPLPPDEEIIPLVKKAGFAGWNAFKIRNYLRDGTSQDLPRFVPATEWFGYMTHSRTVFEAIAGREVMLANGKPHKPKIVVITEDIFEREPFGALRDLVEMER